MAIKTKSVIVSVALTALSMFIIGSAFAGTVNVITSGSSWKVPGWNTEIGFVAEGRNAASGAGDWELGLGQRTDNPSFFNQADFIWGNEATYLFSLTFDGTTANFSLGGTTVSYNNFNFSDTFDGLALRTRTVDGSSIAFTNMSFKGQSIGDYINTNNGPDSKVDWLLLSDFGLLSDGFTLTGDVQLSWTGAAPANSNLAFQVKGATAAPVPIPGAAWLLGSGLLGLIALKRRHRNS